ncbi:MAG: hypothetical protein HQL46_08305 [Gammaproteobacteria bacterium]|nr:hypothetical protein [Gammaproteobacteria bacterium]
MSTYILTISNQAWMGGILIKMKSLFILLILLPLLSHAVDVSESDGITNFTLQLSKPLSVDVSVDYYTKDITAQSPVDFKSSDGTATIKAGEKSTDIPIEIIDDTNEESNETFNLIITNPIGVKFPYGVTEISASRTIVDNDTIVNTEKKPESLPTFDNISLYSTDSPFNKKIDENPEIDPDSSIKIQSLVESDYFLIQTKEYSSPVYFANNKTPKYDVYLPCGNEWELGVTTLKNLPIPDWAAPSDDSGGLTETVYGCGEGAEQDNHMVILDLENRCEYDLWQARVNNGIWEASWANGISMESTGVYPYGISSRGSGFSFLGGVIWPDELALGKINHVLAIAYPYTKAGGPVAPATDSDGISVSEMAIPEGAIIQLDPSFNLASLNLTTYELAIAKAMQEYGMIVVDTNGDSGISFYAIDPVSAVNNPYESTLPDGSYVLLDNLDVKVLPLRVLKLPQQNSSWEEGLKIVDTGCNPFE